MFFCCFLCFSFVCFFRLFVFFFFVSLFFFVCHCFLLFSVRDASGCFKNEFAGSLRRRDEVSFPSVWKHSGLGSSACKPRAPTQGPCHVSVVETLATMRILTMSDVQPKKKTSSSSSTVGSRATVSSCFIDSWEQSDGFHVFTKTSTTPWRSMLEMSRWTVRERVRLEVIVKIRGGVLV